MNDAAVAAGRLARGLEPLHSQVYFAPEGEPAYTAAGLEPGRMSYFAPRAAPMGAVGASVVTATFYNFSPRLVAKSVPRAWELVSAADLLDVRFAVADASLRRTLGDDAVASPEMVEAAGLARTAAGAVTPDGRPLAAGHLDVPWPTEPHLVLWHALSILREHRGEIYDPLTERWFFFNPRRGTTTWVKPALLGSAEFGAASFTARLTFEGGEPWVPVQGALEALAAEAPRYPEGRDGAQRADG